jgi:hypothetical protein
MDQVQLLHFIIHKIAHNIYFSRYLHLSIYHKSFIAAERHVLPTGICNQDTKNGL